MLGYHYVDQKNEKQETFVSDNSFQVGEKQNRPLTDIR